MHQNAVLCGNGLRAFPKALEGTCIMRAICTEYELHLPST